MGSSSGFLAGRVHRDKHIRFWQRSPQVGSPARILPNILNPNFWLVSSDLRGFLDPTEPQYRPVAWECTNTFLYVFVYSYVDGLYLYENTYLIKKEHYPAAWVLHTFWYVLVHSCIPVYIKVLLG